MWNPLAEQTVRRSANIISWREWILNAQQTRSVSIHHFTLKFLLWYVTSSVLYTDSRLHIVELSAVKLKEFQKQNPQIGIGIGVGIVTRMELKKADAHENKRIWRNTSCETIFIQYGNWLTSKAMSSYQWKLRSNHVVEGTAWGLILISIGPDIDACSLWSVLLIGRPIAYWMRCQPSLA